MHDAFLVRRLKSLADVFCDIQRFVDGNQSTPDPVGEGFTFNKRTRKRMPFASSRS